MAISKLQTVAEGKVQPSFANLKEYLHSFIKEEGNEARLLCLDDCSECSVYVDGVKHETVESFFDSSVEVYNYTFLEGLVAQREAVFFNEENVQERVCFSYEIDKNSISDQVIIVYKQKAYDYTTYFKQTPVYNSIEDLVDAKETLTQEIR